MPPHEQIQQIKEQLIQQINSTFPEDKKEEAISKIEAMNEEQLENFLIQNNLIKNSVGTSVPAQQNCIFCSIISGNMQSHKINENKDSIAVLEINPISKGHSLIIPKKHLPSGDKLPQTAFTLAKKTASVIKTKLKPKSITIVSSNLFGHEIINVLPVYENEHLGSERQKTTPEELAEIQNLLEKKLKPKTIRKPRTKIKDAEKEKLWLPKRIP